MNIEISPKAAKYLERLNQPIKGRIVDALRKLAQEPPQGDIKSLAGRDGYRLRVGQYRVLFDVLEDKIVVHDMAPRGQAYKGGR